MALQNRLQDLRHFALAAIDSNQAIAVRQTFRTFWEKLIHLLQEAKETIPRAVNPVVIYDEFMLMLGNECMFFCVFSILHSFFIHN